MKKISIILLHIGYWGVYSGLIFFMMLILFRANATVSSPGMRSLYSLRSPILVILYLPALMGFYGFYSGWGKRYLSSGKIGKLAGYGILWILFTAVFADIMISVFYGKNTMMAAGWSSLLEETILIALLGALHACTGLVVRGFVNHLRDIEIKKEMQKNQHDLEMALIKSQLNPHFLFNTLNNIDALMEPDKEKASLYLNELSDILRFMLYETGKEKIPLSQEITYLKKYLDLQRIRSSNPEFIIFKTEGDTDAHQIEPGLLIPFIENAFTYTSDKKTSGSIDIGLYATKGEILFHCSNIFTEGKKKETGGLGNQLVKRRIELLYPEKHTLEMYPMGNVYHVKLRLKTNA